MVNAFSVLQVVGSFRWPTITYLVFFLILLVAAIVNAQTMFDMPWVYQSYVDQAIPATLLLAYALYRLYSHEDRETVTQALDHNRVLLPLD